MGSVIPNGQEASSQNLSNGTHDPSLSNGTGHLKSNNTTNSTTNGTTATVPNTNATALAEPIAIVGMAMRLPGGIRNATTFWNFIRNKQDARSPVPPSRYNITSFFSANKPGHVGSQHGYFLRDDDVDLSDLDASFWSMTRQEAEAMDPSQRLALEVVYECLENAGKTAWKGEEIGCFVGSFGEDWLDMDAVDHIVGSNLYRMAGYSDFVLANRISYEFDFKGPSMTIRTACSSSLTSLHEACLSLSRGDCSSAIVSGANIILAPRMSIALSDQGVISPSGSCKTFSSDADGYARGEGVSAIYVKKLADAIRDHDEIRAVIRSTCVNSDGKTAGLTMPSTKGHEDLMRKAYEMAGISDYSQTAMIECHGTGTKAGDPIEARAVANVFGGNGIYIGSIKPNLGHSEGNSGLSSIIKMVLAMEHKTIPPNINFTSPNPNIPFEEAKLVVPIDAVPWPTNKAERCGINSFGIGGANAHVILESASCFGIQQQQQQRQPQPQQPSLLLFSAKHPVALRQTVRNHEGYALANPHSLGDLSYTLSARRELHPHRAFSIANISTPFELSPTAKTSTTASPTLLIFTFTGQGAQWAQMALQLFQHQPVFQQSVRQLDVVLASLPNPPTWTLEEEILLSKQTSRLSEAEFSQPCCTAVQIGLVDLLASWGVAPSAVTGHSSGEIGAAYACGAITAKEAILIAYLRGQVTKGLGKIHSGGMAAIGLGRDEVTPYLLPGVIIGCENSPASVTLTGDMDVLEEVMTRIRDDYPDTLVRTLRVECAYHSHHMTAVADRYFAMIEPVLDAKAPRVPFYSSVSGKIITAEGELGASYWVKNLTSPVLFYSAVNQIVATLPSPKAFLEIGPHSALAGPIRQALRNGNPNVDYIATLIRGQNAVSDLLATAGHLWLRNVEINLGRVIPAAGKKFLNDLPSYAWHYEDKYWVESRISKEWRHRKFPHHDVLGSRVSQSTDTDASWRNILRLDTVPWMRDHEIAGDVLFPAAAFVSMAGEAIRQLSGGSGDYTLRRVNISAALVVREGEPVEMVTNMRPVKLTNSLDSIWYDFSVSSLHGDVWTKHLTGQIRAGSEFKPEKTSITEPLPRKVSSSALYRVLKRFGLNYGPRFRPLTDITADVSQPRAQATLPLEQPEAKESPYELHPTTLDATFQLLMAAACKGVLRSFDRLCVPTYIEELYIMAPSGAIKVAAESMPTPSGLRGDLSGVDATGETVIRLKNLQLSPLGDSSEAGGGDPHAAVELQWDRDINFMDAATLMHAEDITDQHMLLEELALACMIETSSQLQGAESDIAHMHKFRDWLATQADKAKAGTYPNIANCKDLAVMGSPKRKALIQDLVDRLASTGSADAAAAVHRIFQADWGIFEGTVNPLDILLEDDVLTGVYDYMQLWEYGDFFRLLAHHKPNLRVLEIGAGTGGTTSTILPHLQSEYGERMYGKYTYTDISAGFFVRAKERFQGVQGLEYAVLDVTKDPIEQGFKPESFDLIVACNVLHATPSLNQTLSNVRKLLHPRGRLLLQELSPTTKWINYVMGPLVGWWMGEADGRPDEPYVTPQRWDQELHAAGFDGINSVKFDGQLNNNIIAMPACQYHGDADRQVGKRVTVLRSSAALAPGAPNARAAAVEKQLRAAGYEIDICTLDEESEDEGTTGMGLAAPLAGQTVVALLDLDQPFFHNVTEEQFSAFQAFLAQVGDAGMLWVTGAGQVGCKDPRYAMVLGFARSVRAEVQMDFATLELEAFVPAAWRVVPDVLREFEHRVREEDMSPVLEYAWHGGAVQTGRFHWIAVKDALREELEPARAKQLDIGRPGALQTLGWKQVCPLPLHDDWVELDVRAVGLNFKDVLIAMNIVAGPSRVDGEGGLGCECCGVVTRVGPGVKDLEVGDRVISIAAGSFATTLTTNEKLCAKMPDRLSFEEGATIPCVYGTAIYALLDLARLEKGQTILIHSACGGVGIAAIQLAKMVGAEIFCTVGTPDKVRFLIDHFDIPSNRIFNSRDTSFLRDVMAETSGRGVDVVLNSLSGELLHASWKCVAEFGVMVEIGKRDFIGQASLSMDLFEQNRSFMGVDLTQICTHKPVLMNRLLRRAIEFFETGQIQPIRPIKQFEAGQVEDAFRYMQKGKHMGKIVITMPEPKSTELAIVTERKKLRLRTDRAYLIVGGLGGLGRSVASWMVERGARHIIFFSRSSGSVPKDDPYLLELEAQGCFVQAISGSVANDADLALAVRGAGKPIGGVLQASMVLNDAAINEMTYAQWQDTVLPKVSGTWKLHKLLLGQKESLDFFFLFSSVSGLVGQPGQANYAAANTFLDAFVQFRHAQGMPASVLDIGAMDDVGYLSQNTAILESLRATALHVLREQDLLDSLQLMLHRSHPPPSPSSAPIGTAAKFSAAAAAAIKKAKFGFVNHSQVGIGFRSSLPLSARSNRTLWKRDPRTAIYRNLEEASDSASGDGAEGSSDNNFGQFLRDAKTNPTGLGSEESVALLARKVGETLFEFMMGSLDDLDVTVPLGSMGVDSLVSIELRNWFRQKVGVEFTVLEIVGSATLLDLGAKTAAKLAEKYALAAV